MTSHAKLISVLLVLVVFGISYSPTWQTPFLMDDSHTIQSNQFIHSLDYIGLPWTSGKAYSSDPENYGYRPLTTNFSQVMWHLGDGSPTAFQVGKKTILLLLSLVVFLVWTEWGKLLSLSQKSVWWTVPAFTLGFFLLHPVATQVGNYIAATSTLLCALFYSLSFLFYLRFRCRDGHWNLASALIFYFFSMMCKEEGITLLAIVAVVEVFYLRLGIRRMAQTLLSYAAVAVVGAWLIRSHFEPTSNIARGEMDRMLYFATQWRAYFHYMGLYFWPFHFNFDNLDFRFAVKLWTVENAVFFALNVALVALGLRWCLKKNPMGIAIIGFYVAILPASSIIPLAEPVNDHRSFISFLFFGFGMIYGLTQVTRGWTERSQLLLASSILIFFASATYYRNLDFKSNRAIWVDTVLKNPNSPRAKNNLALDYMGTAEYEMAGSLLEKCVAQAAFYSPCLINLAIVNSARGNREIADQYFKRSIDLDRGMIYARFFYSRFLIQQGRLEEARKYLSEADAFAQGLHAPVHEALKMVNSRLGVVQ